MSHVAMNNLIALLSGPSRAGINEAIRNFRSRWEVLQELVTSRGQKVFEGVFRYVTWLGVEWSFFSGPESCGDPVRRRGDNTGANPLGGFRNLSMIV